MRKAILNLWPSVKHPAKGLWASEINLESTALPEQILEQIKISNANGNLDTCRFLLTGLELAMAQDTVSVLDGLIHSVKVQPTTDPDSLVQGVILDIFLEHKSRFEIRQSPGLPSVIVFSFSRKPLNELFKGKIIGIDPSGGGKDPGIKGPVSLTEKYVTLEIARELKLLLEHSQAEPILTRTDDSHLTDESRYKLLSDRRPALAVKIQVAGSQDPLEQTYGLLADKSCPQSLSLGSHTAKALDERMGMKIAKIEEFKGSHNWAFPVIIAKPLCLTHFADEANFRAPLFKKRIAQSLYNGIARYLATLS